MREFTREVEERLPAERSPAWCTAMVRELRGLLRGAAIAYGEQHK
jgi:hypothetical protein